MAVMEEAICSYLLTKSAITDLIGTTTSARLWPDALPQGYSVSQGVAATYEIMDSDEESLISDRAGYISTRIQFACYGDTRKGANALARAIKNCGICTLKGVTFDVDIRGVSVYSGIVHYNDNPTNGSQEHRYIAEFELTVDYLEAS